jgi:hypothetical protein
METYCMVLVHPFRIHEQFRHNVSLPGEGERIEPLTLAEALSISWVFAILRGICKILILNFFLQTFISTQRENFPFILDLLESSGFSTYYFLLFSAAVDIIFFPIGAMVITQFWAWVIRTYTKLLNPELPAEEIADQITTHALSSNIFNLVPFIGDIFQAATYIFLLYAGLRRNLEASRSLSMVILATPTLILTMLFSLLLFAIFYLV